MPPTNPQNQPVNSVTLPPLQSMPAQMASPQPQNAANVPAPAPAELDIVNQVKLLINQYGNDPYRLNLALQQLKGEYLAKQFNIRPKMGQN